jgi:fused signal recognition particle receptor
VDRNRGHRRSGRGLRWSSGWCDTGVDGSACRLPDTATPVDRSGGYTASSNITFAQSAPAEPVERIDTSGLPAVGDDASIPRDAPKRAISDVQLPEPQVVEEVPEAEKAPEVPVRPAPAAEPAGPAAPALDEIAPAEGRLEKLRGRLAKSQNTLGRSMLGLLGGGDLDEDSWQDVEDTLLIADLGPVATESVVASLRERMASSRVRTEADARAVLREVLIDELQPDLDRSIKALPHDDKPSVLLVVGVNGTGKTTTVGKLARVLVADGRGWCSAPPTPSAPPRPTSCRPGRRGSARRSCAGARAPTRVGRVRRRRQGHRSGADVVLIDTAGRLHTKTGLMDELGKVKRVVSKRARSTRCCWCSTPRSGRTGCRRPRLCRSRRHHRRGAHQTRRHGKGRDRVPRAAGVGCARQTCRSWRGPRRPCAIRTRRVRRRSARLTERPFNTRDVTRTKRRLPIRSQE